MNLFRWRTSASSDLQPQVDFHLRELNEDGVTKIANGFSEGLIDEVLAGVKQALHRNDAIFRKHIDADGHYPRLINLHMLHEPLLRLFAENELALAVQDAFFGARSSLYTSLYYERGSAQSIHRDTPYFCTRPEYRYLGVWVALEDAGESNGCLAIVRKGHLVPELDRESLALEHFKTLDEVPPGAPAGQDVLWDVYQGRVAEQCRERGLAPEMLTAQTGDVVIWHPQLPHGGSQIKDLTRTRHSFVMHVTPEGTPVYQQDVFFNPRKPMPERSRYKYLKFRSRKYARSKHIDIGHREVRPLADFV